MAKIEIIKKELVSIENFFESKKDEISSSMYSKELNKIFKDLTRIRKEIDSETYFISIIGGIKTGKSTLINLLCHKNVSTTRAGVETTKRPVIVSSGEEDKIIIFKKEELSSLDIDDNDRNLVIDYVKGLDTSLPDSIKIINKDLVEEEVSNLLTNDNEPDSDKIILINITVDKNHLNNYDNCLLRNKIMFIDTPGLDGLESSVGGIGNNNGHWLLNRVDLSIILQSTVSPINNSLDIYLKKLHEQQTNINYMLVHNKFSLKNWLKDISPFENEINKNSIKKALETLSKIAKKKYIWKEVDLAKAEDAYEKSDIDLKTSKKELLLESNFEIFEEEISNLIKKDKQQSHINKCFYDLKNFIHNNEFKSIILDDLQEKENQYKKKYKILKDSFDWEKAKKQIEKDLNSHSLWIVVKAGEVEQITETIAKEKTGGTGLKGLIEETYIENFIRQNGTTRELIHTVKFDRPVEKEIYLKFNVKRRISTQSIDIQNIKNTLANKVFNIAENVTVTELYATIYSASTNFIATGLKVSRDNITFVDNLLIAKYDEEFKIIQTNIAITEI